jgi:hypothetical protein
MAGSLKDILSNLSTDIDQETLLLYLQDKLSAEKKNEVERKLMENEFADAALEGLSELKNRDKIPSLVKQLNTDLRKNLRKKKYRHRAIHIKEQPWIYITFAILLMLVIIGFFLVRLMMKKHS